MSLLSRTSPLLPRHTCYLLPCVLALLFCILAGFSVGHDAAAAKLPPALIENEDSVSTLTQWLNVPLPNTTGWSSVEDPAQVLAFLEAFTDQFRHVLLKGNSSTWTTRYEREVLLADKNLQQGREGNRLVFPLQKREYANVVEAYDAPRIYLRLDEFSSHFWEDEQAILRSHLDGPIEDWAKLPRHMQVELIYDGSVRFQKRTFLPRAPGQKPEVGVSYKTIPYSPGWESVASLMSDTPLLDWVRGSVHINSLRRELLAKNRYYKPVIELATAPDGDWVRIRVYRPAPEEQDCVMYFRQGIASLPWALVYARRNATSVLATRVSGDSTLEFASQYFQGARVSPLQLEGRKLRRESFARISCLANSDALQALCGSPVPDWKLLPPGTGVTLEDRKVFFQIGKDDVHVYE